ncbi:extracellular catalytic domain type 1 short-chain-length polyhydroxyalkanoate depolymerase [Shewanella sp. OMA3-2]|uniref:extracellular catalytic domain type 1 short-chain-length polyhydroxyalkanoate depolymerase n=1 Tax=Shewanella sp. OMA3-2 TaxID=2908650 RepID=UPI001F41EA1F|nr:PHB depolymerase family esterase [Shewanella sp. OMA3-2]UJF22902.1 PHB depolymerase family esterase [Shewanella sp. OMA3-2]
MRNKYYRLTHSFFVLCWITLIPPVQATDSAYIPLTNFGDNPGALTSFYLPLNDDLNALNTGNSSLVVLLHGCIQDGVELANKSGLTTLALDNNFAVLIPQQSYDNNVKRCFNWFSEQDTQLDSGEMLSIKNMILATQKKLRVKHVYIIGLSAGGAMTSAALVNYPDLFQGGAVIAGLPYPCADNLIKAISCMKRGPAQSVDELAQFAQAIHPQQTHWPALTIWTGDSDTVVDANNARMLAAQWQILTQSSAQPELKNQSGYSISRWSNTQHNLVVELVTLKDFGHGIAVNPEIKNGGEQDDFLLKAPISSIMEIIKLWGI